MVFLEDSEFDEIQENINFIKCEIEKQHNKILEIIDAIEAEFRENRELDKNGFPTVSDDVPNADSMLRNMVIDNIESGLMGKIEKIREKYK